LACPYLSLSLSLIFHALNISRKQTVSRGWGCLKQKISVYVSLHEKSLTELLYRVHEKENDYQYESGDGRLLLNFEDDIMKSNNFSGIFL
jgi:hypothetical protein